MHLSGAEFRLADPRDLYPEDDRVSFVFAAVSAPDGTCAPPEHSGVLVQYEDATQCKLYTNPRIQQGPLFARHAAGAPALFRGSMDG